MGEDEFRYRYKEDRVLLDYRQFLPDEGIGQAVFLTDPELQMLRNMCEYLDRRSTWVFQYGIGYYDAPSNDDWDMIQALVADLEEKLMPTGNTIFGYADRYVEETRVESADPGTNIVDIVPAVEGTACRIDACSLRDLDTAVNVEIGLVSGDVNVVLVPYKAKAAGEWETVFPIGCWLSAGDAIRVVFFGCTSGDELVVTLWGVTMNTG